MKQDDEFIADIVLETLEPDRYEFSFVDDVALIIAKCLTYTGEVYTIQFNCQLIEELNRLYVDALKTHLSHELIQRIGEEHYAISSVHYPSEVR